MLQNYSKEEAEIRVKECIERFHEEERDIFLDALNGKIKTRSELVTSLTILADQYADQMADYSDSYPVDSFYDSRDEIEEDKISQEAYRWLHGNGHLA